jgi:hypothetical protein
MYSFHSFIRFLFLFVYNLFSSYNTLHIFLVYSSILFDSVTLFTLLCSLHLFIMASFIIAASSTHCRCRTTSFTKIRTTHVGKRLDISMKVGIHTLNVQVTTALAVIAVWRRVLFQSASTGFHALCNTIWVCRQIVIALPSRARGK